MSASQLDRGPATDAELWTLWETLADVLIEALAQPQPAPGILRVTVKFLADNRVTLDRAASASDMRTALRRLRGRGRRG